MKNTDFSELVARVYENAKAHGFHEVEHEDGHYLMLVVCELAEAVEADRADRRADRKEFERLAGTCEDIIWPHLFEMYIKDTVEDELAEECGIDLLWHIDQKMKYNEVRPMMHGKKY